MAHAAVAKLAKVMVNYSLYQGQEVNTIKLWLENGRDVQEKAERNQEFLTSKLNIDADVRRFGEWGIVTIDLALGAGFPECDGRDESGLHWEMIRTSDGDLFYRIGKTVVS